VTARLPRFKRGDLVRCRYDFHSYYVHGGSHGFVGDNEHYIFYGLVTKIEDGQEGFWGWGHPYVGPYYSVLCTDGRTRYFTEDEMTDATKAEIENNPLTGSQKSDKLEK